MKKIFTILALVIVFTNCNNSSNLTDQYEIIGEKFEPTYKKALIDVRLKRRVTEDELKSIAAEIKSKNKKAERFMITYFLEDTQDYSQAWAVTNYNPDESVSILGATVASDKIMNDTTHDKTNSMGDILGTWKINKYSMEITVTLYKENNIIKMLSVYPDGGNSVDTLTEKKLDTQVAYYKKFDTPNEYYIIEANNNLSVYSNNKKYTEAVRQ